MSQTPASSPNPRRPARRPRPYSVTSDSTGLSAWYRFRWRFMYIASSTFGSAQRQGTLDPRKQLQRERAARLRAGYARLGQEPPAGLTAFTGH